VNSPNMQDASGFNWKEVLEWFKGGGLVVVTVIGLLLYFFLSIPAVIFYGHLGISASEVGVTYGSLLSGSTAEVAVVLIALTCAFLAVAFVLALTGLYARLTFVVFRYPLFFRPRRRPNWELTYQEFEERMKVFESVFSQLPEMVEVFTRKKPSEVIPDRVAQFRRRRELQIIGVRTEEQSAELKAINTYLGRLNIDLLQFPWVVTKHWMQRWGRSLAVFFLVITIVIGLPALAYFQASQVLDGKAYVGHNFGIFDYHADLVTIDPASMVVAPSIGKLGTKEFFWLGENSQYVILYSPKSRSTIRIPTTAVVITSVG
jgi:hypothetical protein